MGFLVKNRLPVNLKLTPAKVIQIKIGQERLIKELALKYNVGRSAIRNVLMEKTWRQVRVKKAL